MSDEKGLVSRRVHADALADSIESDGLEARDKEKKGGRDGRRALNPPRHRRERNLSVVYLRPPCRWVRREAAWFPGSFPVIVVTFVFPWIPRSMPGLAGKERGLRINDLRASCEGKAVPGADACPLPMTGVEPGEGTSPSSARISAQPSSPSIEDGGRHGRGRPFGSRLTCPAICLILTFSSTGSFPRAPRRGNPKCLESQKGHVT